MKLLVITLAPTLIKENTYHSYAPYVKEMDIWFAHASEVTLLSPTSYSKKLLLEPFKKKGISVKSIPSIEFSSFSKAIKSIAFLPIIKLKMFREMYRADHIHLRCPGNIGLIGCLVQLFFPKTPKTAKYAGNWDPNAKQPLSYRFQKWILSNTFLTRNMTVLVYGEWPQQTKNIKPFFTATYSNLKATVNTPNFKTPFQFIFVGTLSPGKQPLYAVQLVESLLKNGFECRLDFYGEGEERKALERYVEENNLKEHIKLHGNQTSEIIETAYLDSDFLILPSKSEGWPKVVAEAMFWGVVPLVTKISCVPWMLDYGKRGILLESELSQDLDYISNLLKNIPQLKEISQNAQKWSQQYTLESFEGEIKKLLQ